MGQYYYAVASLPMLQIQDEPAVSMDEFIDLCRQWMSRKDFGILHRIMEHPASAEGVSNIVYNSFASWLVQIKNNLAVLRAQKKGVEVEGFIHGDLDSQYADFARQIFQTENPAEAENLLDTLTWNFLDNLEVGHYFDLEKLIIYYLKLLLLEKRAQQTIERGNKRFTQMYDNVVQSQNLQYE